MATREQIEDLKKSWCLDLSWDIEDTTGFEAHYNELLRFRIDYNSKYKELKDLASEYIKNHDNKGFVVFDKDMKTIAGWSLKLDNSSSFIPNAYAVNNDGYVFIAKGGNEYDGAKKWEVAI